MSVFHDCFFGIWTESKANLSKIHSELNTSTAWLYWMGTNVRNYSRVLCAIVSYASWYTRLKLLSCWKSWFGMTYIRDLIEMTRTFDIQLVWWFWICKLFEQRCSRVNSSIWKGTFIFPGRFSTVSEVWSLCEIEVVHTSQLIVRIGIKIKKYSYALSFCFISRSRMFNRFTGSSHLEFAGGRFSTWIFET